MINIIGRERVETSVHIVPSAGLPSIPAPCGPLPSTIYCLSTSRLVSMNLYSRVQSHGRFRREHELQRPISSRFSSHLTFRCRQVRQPVYDRWAIVACEISMLSSFWTCVAVEVLRQAETRRKRLHGSLVMKTRRKIGDLVDGNWQKLNQLCQEKVRGSRQEKAARTSTGAKSGGGDAWPPTFVRSRNTVLTCYFSTGEHVQSF